MKLSEKIAVVVLALLFAAAWGFAGERYEEVIDQSFPLVVGGSVSVDNVNGDVTIEVWERDEVRVYAVKRASSPELLEGLRVEISAADDRVDIDTEYPSQKRRHDGEGFRNQHTSVEYTLTVPRHAVIEDVDLVNGDLFVTGVEGGLEAATVNGDIVVREGAGEADLETVNGGIELWADRVADGLRLQTVNGAIDLHLAAGAAADLRAETVNGRLSNDFDIAVHKGKYVGSSFAGAVGGGGSRVDLETVNGRIAVHRW